MKKKKSTSENIIDEELEQMHETGEYTIISSKIFHKPLRELGLPVPVSMEIHAPISEAIQIMQQKKSSYVVITNQNRVVGIVTERDIVHNVAAHAVDTSHEVERIMTFDPIRLRPEDTVAHAINNMHIGGFRHLPIVNEKDELMAVVSIRNLNSFLVAHFPKAIFNIESIPFRGESKREDA